MKKKVVSMMLALTLVFTEIPAYTSYAAEISTDTVDAVEENETETTENVETETLNNGESESTQTTEFQETETEDTENTETTETGNTEPEIKTAAAKRPTNDVAAFHIAENGKAVGSDGVLYEDIVYLSADAVRALDEDMQSIYFEVCDSIAELKAQEDALNGAVIAVDEDGNLHYSISIPTKKLAEGTLFQKETKQNLENEQAEASETENSESIEESSTEEQAETLVEDVKSEEASSESAPTEEASEEKDSTEEASTEAEATESVSEEETEDDKTSTEENSANDTSAETESTEASSKEEESTEENTVEETSEEQTTTEENSEEENSTEAESTEESSEEDSSIEDTEVDSTELETQEADTEEYVFSAENMELLEHGQEETFEVVDNVKVDPIVDMGYGSGTEMAQFNSTLSSKTYFKNQLDDVEKKIYDAGVNKLTKGTNQFEYTYPIAKINDDYNSGTIDYRTLWATSAIIMQYPYDMDWMDLSKEGKTTIEVGVYAGTNYLTGKLRLTLDKSSYYNADLVNKANNKVIELAEKAQHYAMENYPSDVVYGVVKFFDDWICENNYYDMIGVYGGNIGDSPAEKEAYYFCHSSYGILLKGYGVCESYALAMTRLLDALGIPNMYATGNAGVPGDLGGHAWNYVEMPDAKWYLQDSTWNDDTDPNHTISYGDYLLCANDGMHFPKGGRWLFFQSNGQDDKRGFEFVNVNNTNYSVSQSGILDTKVYNLNLKDNKTAQINASDSYGNIYKPVFTSSNAKVVKVDKNGKITAVSAGKADITVAYNLNGMQLKDTCTVNVCAVKNLTFARTKKTSDTISLAMSAGSDAKEVILSADCGEGNYDVENMIRANYMEAPTITVPKKDIAAVTFDRAEGNSIVLKVAPKQQGANSSYKIALGGKTVTLKVSVGENLIDQSWFKVEADYIVDGKTAYTGKALKPKVTKAEGAPADLKFKTTYYSNKDAGTASVVVNGTGKYAGEETFEFAIESLPIAEGNVITANIKSSQNIAYNGGVNQAKATVKYKNGKTKLTLKAGVDYDIVYNNNGVETTEPQKAGSYAIVGIRGKGNFSGTYAVTGATYTIKANSLKKAKVSFASDNEVIVKIGKNELPSTDYTVKYFSDNKCMNELSAKPRTKGTYYVKVLPSENAKDYLTDEKKVTLKIK